MTWIERVLAACAEYGGAVEVNGNPWRLDLDWRWLRRGIELGCNFSINPDAIPRARSFPRRAGAWRLPESGMPAERVISTLDRDSFARWLVARRERAGRAKSLPTNANRSSPRRLCDAWFSSSRRFPQRRLARLRTPFQFARAAVIYVSSSAGMHVQPLARDARSNDNPATRAL
jgi:hypothetical protein